MSFTKCWCCSAANCDCRKRRETVGRGDRTRALGQRRPKPARQGGGPTSPGWGLVEMTLDTAGVRNGLLRGKGLAQLHHPATMWVKAATGGHVERIGVSDPEMRVWDTKTWF